ncbi:MAG TPA: FAD-dependent monooxygenase [Chitinophagaceae bacterium]|nr:FAD-dependent monooxygenase [Chitinophagaceae bacterium]
MKSDLNTDVLIVGAGPTGLMMACQLAINNIRFRIIDKNEDHTTQSRALVIQARSIEILDQMGIADKAIQQGKIAKAIGAFFNGKKVLRITVNDMGAGLTRFPNLLMLEQSHTENILVEFLSEHGHNVDRRTELKSFIQSRNEVTSILKLPDGNEETITSKYVIGSDGTHSIVRDQLKIPFGGKTYEESLFVLDCKAEVDIPNDEMYLTFADTAFGGFFPLTNGRWRILGNLPKELEEKEEITFEDIEKGFAKRINMNVTLYNPQWISAYRSHHRYASIFRKERCFLTGDAAHIHSPVGAQGMNTGLQDAYNLAWKLSLVLKKKAKDSLLDTYTEERITIAKNLVRSTDKVFNVVTSNNIFFKTFRLYIIPIALKLVSPLFQKLKFIQRFAFKMISEIGISYRNKSLSQNASLGKFPGYAPKPGDRLPFVQFKDASGNETNIQGKVKGNLFCFLIFSDNIPNEIVSAIESFKDLFLIETIPFTEQTKNLNKEFGIKKTGCYLIRPDMYIAYRAAKFDTEHLTKYLSRFLNNEPILR